MKPFVVILTIAIMVLNNALGQVRTDIRYNEYVWPATHNSYNTSAYPGIQSFNGYGDNQTLTITEQLELGIRVLMLDVYRAQKNRLVCGHGLGRSIFGNENLNTYLYEIRDFLKENPGAVISIIWENHINPQDLLDALDPILTPYIYKHHGEWPAIENMIRSNQRLVNFIEKDNWPKDSEPDTKNQMIYAWDQIFDTPFNIHASKSWQEKVQSWTLNRGKATNALLLLNAFVKYPLTGIGNPNTAAVINTIEFVKNNIRMAQTKYDKMPNFIALDFINKESHIAGFIHSINLQAPPSWDSVYAMDDQNKTQ